MYQAGLKKRKNQASQDQRSKPAISVKIKAKGHSAHRLLKKLGMAQNGGNLASGQ